MKLGFIGLGKMGREMVLHLLEEGVDVVVFNRTKKKIDELIGDDRHHKTDSKKKGQLIPSYNIKDIIKQLESPRIIWLMVEHGKAVDEVIDVLLEVGATKGDIIIDGGNSFYKDSIRRYQKLNKKGIQFLDVGTSGGLEGARNGACLMVGGEEGTYKKIEQIFKIFADKSGHYAYFGPAGAGHFVKMVHNGVEYGMLQAIGEGFEILEKGPYKLNLQQIAKNWGKGSVVRGWLIELLERALKKDPKLENIEGVIGGGTTGEWTVKTAKEFDVNIPVITKSLEARRKSLAKTTFSGKVIAALRREFGGHEVQLKK